MFILNGFLFEQERPSARASGAHKAAPRSRCSLGASILIGWPLLPQDGRTTAARPSFLQVLILRDFKRDYILDTKSHFHYPPFMLFFLGFASRLMCLTTFGWNRCFISSSLVMSFGCFFFFMVSR